MNTNKIVEMYKDSLELDIRAIKCNKKAIKLRKERDIIRFNIAREIKSLKFSD